MRLGATEVAEATRLLLALLCPPDTATVGGVVADDLGLVGDTPTVTVTVGGVARRMAYLPPHAIQVGRPVFVERIDARPDAPWIVLASNYQCDPAAPEGGAVNTGSTLGAGADATAGGSVDWASDMHDAAVRRGSMLPLVLGKGRAE